MVELVNLSNDEKNELKQLIEKHLNYTKSTLAVKFLKDWDNYVKHFTKVFPTDYKNALERLAKESKEKQLTA